MSSKETKFLDMDSLLLKSKPILRELSYNCYRMKFLFQKIHFVVSTIFYLNFQMVYIIYMN